LEVDAAMVEFSLVALSGACVGGVVGLTGIGSGALTTPILVLLFGVPPSAAVGTALMVASITKAFGTVIHGRYGAIDWMVVRRLAAGSLPAAALTALALASFGHERLANGLVVQVLGLALILTASGLLFKRRLLDLGRQLRARTPVNFKRAQPALTLIAGFVLGVLVTLTSVGAGALGTVVLVGLYPDRMKPATLVGTDLAHALPLGLVAGMGHLVLGNVERELLAPLLVGSIPAVCLGAMLSTRVPDLVLGRAIAIVLGITGVRLLW
jgi:hypothetical protein